MRCVRIAAIAGFEKRIKSLGGDFNQICNISDVAPGIFSRGQYDKFISLDKLAELLMNAAIETNSYQFGLMLGREKKSSMLGILGLLIRDNPDVQSALYSLVDNIHLHLQDSISIEFSVDHDTSKISIDPVSLPESGRHYVYDLILGCLLGLLKSLCGKKFIVTEINMDSRTSDQQCEYEMLLGAKVNINQLRNEIVFPTEFISKKLNHIDPQYNAILQEYRNKNNKFQYRKVVKDIIRDVLPKGYCNIDYVSCQLNLNKRTLNRKLAAEGSSFKELSIEVKSDTAKKLLAKPLNSVTSISLELGYSETSSFTNAFKSWFGVTPKKWQIEHCE